MAEIVPVIIAEDFWAIKKKIEAVKSYVKLVQIDVADGRFVKNSTWNNPADLKMLETELDLEVHLMTLKPEDHIEKWCQPPVKRIIFHYEATNKHQDVISKIKEAGIEAGIALNPETSVDKIDKLVDQVDLVLFLTVHPGQTGQKFLDDIIPKITSLRDKNKGVKIGADGGINLETAPKLVAAGVDVLAVGSAIWKNEDIEKAIKQLKSI